MIFQYIYIVLYLSSCLTKANGACMDIDMQACQMMHAKRPDMCNDVRIAEGTCPRVCGKCPLKCYHCDIPLMDYNDCYTTKICAKGKACMLRQLKSTADGHEEYDMTCASQQTCDGPGLSFLFGKRSINARDVHARCCFTDLCNSPSRLSPVTSTIQRTSVLSTTTTRQPTTVAGCRRDIVFMIDTSMRFYGSGTGIHQLFASSYSASTRLSIQLIHDVAANITIGRHDNLVAVGSFDDSVHAHWDLIRYYDKYHLLQAITKLQYNISFRSHGDLENAVQVVVNNVLSVQHGDRVNYANVVVIITDTHSVFHNEILKRSLERKSRDIIVVYVGTDTSPNPEVDGLATGHDHVIHVSSYSALASDKAKLLKLLCN